MATTSSSTFGSLLRRHRLAAGLTQEGLAEKAGVSARGVQDLERGVHAAPRAETVRLLSDALALSAEERAGLIAAAHPDLAAPAVTPPVRPGLRVPPIPATPLVGREREVAQACAWLRRGDGLEATRLLTLTGPGGVGKTRLALAIAAELRDDFLDGVVWVELAPVSDPILVPSALARALGVHEDGAESIQDRLAAGIAGLRLLLVLDNLEHLLPAAPLIAQLLAAGSGLTVLATSRARLRLRGEREFPVGPLALPSASRASDTPMAGLAGVAAVRLFVERAADARPDFVLDERNAATVAEICRRLDGLPLALELAAARVKALPPAALLTRLEQRLPVLSSGARDLPLRQQTMRDTIAWSYDLLSDAEQGLFRRLAVFAGGFTLDAAEHIVSASDGSDRGADLALDELASLVDQSLLRQSEPPAPDGPPAPRFSMLETVREYALERLGSSGETDRMRRAHVDYCLALAETSLPRIHGPEGPAVLDRLETEHDNLRTALAWTIEQGDAGLALRLVYPLWRLWWMHSHLDEGRLWLERALAVPDRTGAVSVLRPRTLAATGYFARIQGAYARAFTLGEEALTVAREIDDAHGIAGAHHLLGLVATDQGQLDQARTHLQAALAFDREAGDSHGVAFQLSSLGEVAIAQGTLAEAATFIEEALAIWRERGDDWSIAWGLIQLGKVARAQGDRARAVALLRQSLTSNAKLGDKDNAARAISELAAIASEHRLFDAAARLYGSVAALREAIGAPLAPAERARYDQEIAATRAGLDDQTFEAAWAAGLPLSLEDAVAEALVLAERLASSDNPGARQ
jgi:predicted ATPase/DNA-binding XRE family transcriptional regulator